MKHWWKNSWRALLLQSTILLGLGTIQPPIALGAEDIVFGIFGPFEIDITIDELEKFATTGEVEGNLSSVVSRLDDAQVQKFREALTRRVEIDQVTIYRASNAPLLESVYKRLGRVVQGNRGSVNHWRALRGAIVIAAGQPEGITLLNVMQEYPLETIRINISDILEITDELTALASYRDTAIEVISQQSAAEIAAENVSVAGLPDPRQPGPYAVEKQVLPLRIRAIRQTRLGLAESYTFNTDLYLPQGLDKPAPLVVISHGFGDFPATFGPYGEHLASHGYIVAIPEHIGSDAKYREGLLRGELTNTTSPIEYVNRPLDIQYLLDELETSALAPRINFDQIGVMGHSFGGYTVLAIAGAPINQERLATCTEDDITLNVSLLLQCRAEYLPPVTSILTDERVKAVVAVNPITSQVLGPESLSQIEIPTLMVTGTSDLVAPSIQEQIHPFVWLETSDKYLATMVPGTHNSITENPENPDRGALALLSGPRPDLGRSYLKGMSLAFFETYVRDDSTYQPHLSAAYAREISDDELGLYLVKSLEPEAFETAYGRRTPFPVIPDPVGEAVAITDEPILKEIAREGILKIAMREDAPPFGYVDPNGVWTGYCVDFADRLAAFLAERLNRPDGVEVVRLPSTLEDRFALVRDETVHLECGPNTIFNETEEGVAFTGAFFASGTQFLVTAERDAEEPTASGFFDKEVGILADSATQQFLDENYPQANVETFEGATGRAEGVQALVEGKIGAFASDGILLMGEVARQGLELNDFALVPDQPLTCDFYGLLVPDNDPEWTRAIDDFVDADDFALSKKWAEKLEFNFIGEIDRCFNRTPS